ncbi:hypothetical protein Tco_0086089 [Tanacetum coccineum]
MCCDDSSLVTPRVFTLTGYDRLVSRAIGYREVDPFKGIPYGDPDEELEEDPKEDPEEDPGEELNEEPKEASKRG